LNKSTKILIVPLDWGLGHATRCIPLIHHLISLGCNVVLAGNERTNGLLWNEFPNLDFRALKGYEVQYSPKKWQLPFVLLKQVPRILSIIHEEHQWLENLLENEHFDAVISDNRYGLYTNTIPCIFITHQTSIKVPHLRLLQNLVNKVNQKWINRFSACWIPDDEIHRLSGELSSIASIRNVQFLGVLSRFGNAPKKLNHRSYEVLVLLSGPEPQRSLLESSVIKQLKQTSIQALIVRGIPAQTEYSSLSKTIDTVNHLNANQLEREIMSSNIIICRSGYTTLMDLVKLKKHAILIPTPGQTEQEYLAKKMQEKKWFLHVEQARFSIEDVLKQYNSFDFKSMDELQMDQYIKVLNQFVQSIQHL